MSRSAKAAADAELSHDIGNCHPLARGSRQPFILLGEVKDGIGSTHAQQQEDGDYGGDEVVTADPSSSRFPLPLPSRNY